jgi:predicted nucleotidyltransferase
MVLPEFNRDGDLPVGVHCTNWQDLQARFCRATPRRIWLAGRLEALLDFAARSGHLRRVFIWGSFVTAKPAPKDLDLLLVMDEEFEVKRIELPAQAIFDSVRAKLLFESDVFWARSSIGEEVLQLWLETYQTSRNFGKRGIVELELL